MICSLCCEPAVSRCTVCDDVFCRNHAANHLQAFGIRMLPLEKEEEKEKP